MEKKFFSKLGFMYFLGAIIIYVVQYAGIAVGKLVAPLSMEDGSFAFMSYMIPMFAIGYPLMAFLITRVPAAERVAEKKKMTVGQWIVAFIISYALVYICNLLGGFLTTIIGIFKQSSVENPILNTTMGINTLTSLIFMVILAPIAEEFIFRKLLIDRASRYGEGLAIFLSGLMFGLFHANLNQFVFTFVMGCFYGFIYAKTRNLLYSILLHVLNNFMASILSMLVMEKSGMLELMSLVDTVAPEEFTNLVVEGLGGIMLFLGYVLLLLGLVITGVVLLIVKRKKFVLTHTEEDLPKGKRFTTVFLNVGMILFCGLMIVQIILQLMA